MIVGGQTEARAQLSSTIIDYHEPFDQGFSLCVLDMAGLGRANWLKNCSDLLEQVVQW